VRIERENGDEVGSVWAVFTSEELEQLFGSLMWYREHPSDVRWHCHVGHGDQELTIAIGGGA
jgi:hypothetical protein